MDNECKHEVTYMVPMYMGYIEKCIECNEVIKEKEFAEPE